MKLTKKDMSAIEAAFAKRVAEKEVVDAIFFDDDLKRFGLRMRSSGPVAGLFNMKNRAARGGSHSAMPL